MEESNGTEGGIEVNNFQTITEMPNKWDGFLKNR